MDRKTEKKNQIPIPAPINKSIPIEIEDFLMKTATGTYIEINDLLMDCNNILNQVSNNLCLFNIINNEGLTMNDKFALLQNIYEAKQNTPNFFYSLNTEGQTILHLLCEKGYKDIIDYLKNIKNIDLNKLNIKDSSGKFPAEYYIEKYISIECTDNDFYNPEKSVLKNVSANEERKNYLNTLQELESIYDTWGEKDVIKNLINDVYNGEHYELAKKKYAYEETINKIEKDNLPNKSVEKKRAELKFVNDIINWFSYDVKVNSIDEDNKAIQEKLKNEFRETEEKIKFELVELNDKINIKTQLDEINNKYIFEPMSLYYSFKSIKDSEKTSYIDYLDEQRNQNILFTQQNNQDANGNNISKDNIIQTIINSFDDKVKFTEDLNKKYGEDNKTKSFFYDSGDLVILSDLKSSLYTDLDFNKKIFYLDDNESFHITDNPRLYVFPQKMEKLELKMYIENYRTLNYFIEEQFININDKENALKILVLYDLCIKHLNVEEISNAYYEKIYNIQQNYPNIILDPPGFHSIENLIQPFYNIIYFFKFIFEKNAISSGNYVANVNTMNAFNTVYNPVYNPISINPHLINANAPGFQYFLNMQAASYRYKKLLIAINSTQDGNKHRIYIFKEIVIESIYDNIHLHPKDYLYNMNRIAIFFMIYTLLDFLNKKNVTYNFNNFRGDVTYLFYNSNNEQGQLIDVFIELLHHLWPPGIQAQNTPLITEYYNDMHAQYGKNFINLIMVLIEMHYMPYPGIPAAGIAAGIGYPTLRPGSPIPITSYYRNFQHKLDILNSLAIFHYTITLQELVTIYTSLFPDLSKKNIPFDPVFTTTFFNPKIENGNYYADAANYYMEGYNPAHRNALEYWSYRGEWTTQNQIAAGTSIIQINSEYAFYNNALLIPKMNENLFLYSPEKKKNGKKFYELLYDNVKGLLTNYYTFQPTFTNQPNRDNLDEYCDYALTFAKKSPIYNELYRHINYDYMWNNTNIVNDEYYTTFINNFTTLKNQIPQTGGAQPHDYFNIILKKNNENLPKKDDKKDKTPQENKIVQAYTYKKINRNPPYIILRENVNPEDYQISNLHANERNNFINKIDELYTMINDDYGILHYLNTIEKYDFEAPAPQIIFNFNYINYPDIISKFLTIYAKLKDLKHELRIDFPESFGADFNIDFIKNFEKYKVIINNLIENIKKNISNFDEKINEFYLLIRNKIQLATNIVEYHNTLFSLQNTYYNITDSSVRRDINGNMYNSYVSSDFPVINLELIPKTYKEFYSKYPNIDNTATDIDVNSVYGMFFKVYDELQDKDYEPLQKYVGNNNIKYMFYETRGKYYLYYQPIAGTNGTRYKYNRTPFYNIKKYFPLIAEYYFNNLYKTIKPTDDTYGYKKIVLQELLNIKFKEYIIDILYQQNTNLYKQTLINFTTSMYDTSINNAIIGDEMKNYKLYRNKCARQTNDLLNLIVNNDYVMQNAVICVIQNKNNDVLKELLKITIPGIGKIKNIAINKINEYIKFIDSRYKNSNLFYEGLNATICNLVNSEQHKISYNINLEIVKDVFKNLNKYLKDTLNAKILLDDSLTIVVIGGFSQKKYKLKKIHNGGANIITATKKYKENILRNSTINEFQHKYKDFVDLDKTELSQYNILNNKILEILTVSINRELKFQIINSLIYLFYPEPQDTTIMIPQMTDAINEYFNIEHINRKIDAEVKKKYITNIVAQDIIYIIYNINNKYKNLVNSSSKTITYEDDYTTLINNSVLTYKDIVVNNIYKFAENELKYMILKYNDLGSQQSFDKFALFKTLEISATDVKLSEEIDLFLKNSLYKQINALSTEIHNVDYSNIMISVKSMLMNVKLNEKVTEDFDKTLSNLFDLYKNWSATAGEVLYNSIKEYLDAMYEISLYNDMIITLQTSY